MNRFAIAGLLLLLVGIAGAVAFFLRADDGASTERREPIAQGAEDGRGPAPRGPLPKPREDAAPAELERPAAPATEVAPADPRPVHLAGRVTMEGGSPAGGARVAASAVSFGGSDASAEAVTAADGTVHLDVAGLLAVEGIREIALSVDHPDGLPHGMRVSVPSRSATPAAADALPPFEVVLARAAVLTGRITTAPGLPVAGGFVAMAAATGEPLAESEPLMDVAYAGHDGAFRLRVPPGAQCALFAGAEGMRTVYRELRGGEVSTADFVLEPGAVLAGTVTDGAGDPLPGVNLRATPEDTDGALTVVVKGREFLPLGRDGWLGHASLPGTTDAQGRYSIVGLEPGKHRITVEGFGESTVLRDVLEDQSRVVDVPASDADFRVPFLRLRVHLRAGGEPVPAGASLMLTSRRRTMSIRNVTVPEGGAVDLVVREGSTYSLALSAGAREFPRRDLVVPLGSATTSMTVDFGPVQPRGSLAVTLEGLPDPPAEAGLALFRRDDGERFVPAAWRDLRAEKGRFTFPDLPAGPWRLVVRPGGGWWSGGGPYLDAEVDVEIPDAGPREIRVTIRRGALLHIHALGPEKFPVEVDCAIRDGEGGAVAVQFLARREDGGTVSRTAGLVGGPYAGRNTVVPALPAGTYTVRFSGEGWLEAEHAVTLVEGEEKNLIVPLERAR